MNPLTSFLVIACAAAALAVGYFVDLYPALILFALAVIIAASLKMANVWQKFVILRLGAKFPRFGPTRFPRLRTT
jgi:hypothetical protein